jgi:hypothetical protein
MKKLTSLAVFLFLVQPVVVSAEDYILSSGVADVWLSDQPAPIYTRTTFEQAEAADHVWIVINGYYPNVVARQGASTTMYTNYHCSSVTEVGFSMPPQGGQPAFIAYINERGQRSRCGQPSAVRNGQMWMFRETTRLVLYFQKR